MTPFDMGRISAFLLKHRKIELRSNKGSSRNEEHELAVLLRDAPIVMLSSLGGILNGYGFELVALSGSDVSGIGPGEAVYLLVRKQNTQCLLLDVPRALECMEPSLGSVLKSKVWLTQFWLLHLDLIYTQRDRGPDERSQWIEATFTDEILSQAMRDFINGVVRRLKPEELTSNEIYRVLTSEKGQDIPRYTKRFLNLMVDAGLLEHRGDGVYRQTLLSACEMRENYIRVLAPLMVGLDEPGEDPVENPTYAGVVEDLLIEQVDVEEDAQ